MSKTKSPRAPKPPTPQPLEPPLSPDGRPIVAMAIAKRCGHMIVYTTKDKKTLRRRLAKAKDKWCPVCWLKRPLSEREMECQKPDSERGAA